MKVLRGDCRAVMRGMEANSVDAIVTDPPYELGFMGKSWDRSGIAFDPATWAEALRVLKPGGHMLAFSGSRTYHRMAVAIEDAGFDVRDQIMWVYGSGFPKSHDVSKGIDEHFFNEWLDAHPVEREQYREQLRQAGKDTKAREHVKRKFRRAAGAEREVVGRKQQGRLAVAPGQDNNRSAIILDITTPATDAAREWQGWGTALKPAHEPIVVARKPLSEATVAANVLRWGTGAINVDGCRVNAEPDRRMCGTTERSGETSIVLGARQETRSSLGRWPANLIHDGSGEVLAAFPDTGSAARFFYCAKASKRDRDDGLQGMATQVVGSLQGGGQKANDPVSKRFTKEARNIHPTVKPTPLMRHLCRLVTPPGGTVFDPFTGSGSTGRGAVLEGFTFIGAELSAEYATIARRRIAAAQREAKLVGIALDIHAMSGGDDISLTVRRGITAATASARRPVTARTSAVRPRAELRSRKTG